MKSKLVIFIFLVLIILLGIYFYWMSNNPGKDIETQLPVVNEPTIVDDTNKTGMSNPASDNCIAKGGELEIVSNADGSQFGLCQLDGYACEEWTLFRNECDIVGDAQKIREALIAKGLNLSNSTVVINKHLGKYISGSVNPNEPIGGGGYVFAVKDGDTVKVLADGNGIIACSAFKDYPDFSTYLLPACYDEVAGDIVTR